MACIIGGYELVLIQLTVCRFYASSHERIALVKWEWTDFFSEILFTLVICNCQPKITRKIINLDN